MKGVVLVAGLGNPGDYYAKHRHNVGYWFINILLDHYQAKLKHERKFYGSLTSVRDGTHLIYLYQADAVFINESGLGLRAVSDYYKIKPNQILVVHDEIDFPVAKVRLKEGGGHAGHNGLRNITQHIGADFWRLRVGVGHPGSAKQVNKHVLSNAREDESLEIETALMRAKMFLPQIYDGNFTVAMNELHVDGEKA